MCENQEESELFANAIREVRNEGIGSRRSRKLFCKWVQTGKLWSGVAPMRKLRSFKAQPIICHAKRVKGNAVELQQPQAHL